MKKLFFVGAALLPVWLAPLAPAFEIFSDSFDYPDGSLTQVSGGIWANHSGTPNQVLVNSAKLFLSQTNSEDVNAQLPGGPYPATTNVPLYVSFIINLQTLPSSSGPNHGTYFAHFKDTGTGFRCKLFVTTNGVPSPFFRVGTANAANTASVLLNTNLSLNSDYRVVSRYAPSNATSQLWLNPTAETDTSVIASDNTTTIPVSAFALRQSFSSGDGMGSLYLDDLLVGTAFSDVVGSSPPELPPTIQAQPQSQTVTEGASVTFTVQATGNPMPTYQWQFQGTNLPGAISSALVLTNVTAAQEGTYVVFLTNSAGWTNSDPATLTVNSSQPVVPSLSVVTYNVKGNGATDWSTNSTQVQALGRQMQYLQPDIITFQEIPYDYTYEMTNFIHAYLPGHWLATNSGTDGWIRSIIASKYPITRSQKWLDGVSLATYGYNGNFTRDLFEAQIAVPGFEQPVHAFTVHLKSGSTTDDDARRAAEASAISNYFVAGFLTTNASHLYFLTGDMNESDTNAASIQRLASAPTGLHLTTPVNPYSGSYLTYSIQNSGLTKRFDYIMPGSMLFTNITSSEVFRTDLLPSPPPPLLADDDKTASDHLPVVMRFGNPFNYPFRLVSIGRTNESLTLKWESTSGRQYAVEGSSDFAAWSALASNLIATGTNYTFVTNLAEPLKFFRVYRQP